MLFSDSDITETGIYPASPYDDFQWLYVKRSAHKGKEDLATLYVNIDTSKVPDSKLVYEIRFQLSTALGGYMNVPTVLKNEDKETILPKGFVSIEMSECGHLHYETGLLEEEKQTCVMCEARGENVEKIELFKNNKLVETDDRNVLTIGIPVASMIQGIKYVIPSPETQDAGHYTCRVTNNDGSIQEKYRTILVFPLIMQDINFEKRLWTQTKVSKMVSLFNKY